MLAGHLVNGAQPLFHFRQTCRVGLIVFDKVAQVVAGLADLDLGFVQHLDGVGQCRHIHGKLFQLLQCLANQISRAGFIFRAKQGRLVAVVQNCVCLAQLGLFPFQLFLLAVFQCQAVQFFHLVTQQLQLGLRFIGILPALGQPLADLVPGFPGFAGVGGQSLNAGNSSTSLRWVSLRSRD